MTSRTEAHPKNPDDSSFSPVFSHRARPGCSWRRCVCMPWEMSTLMKDDESSQEMFKVIICTAVDCFMYFCLSMLKTSTDHLPVILFVMF